MRISIIGTGSLGRAIARGVKKSGLFEEIIVTAVQKEKLKTFADSIQVTHTTNNQQAVAFSSIVLLCVKPKVIKDVLMEIKGDLIPNHLLITTAAGVTLSSIEKVVGKIPAVRVMTNVGASVGLAATAFAKNNYVSNDAINIIQKIFGSIGEVVEVQEELLDAVTGLSGSGTAYIYMVLEAMIDGGVKAGLPRDVARVLAIQTVLASATIAKNSGLHPAELKDKVTTPNGTTIEALRVLERGGVRSAFIEAIVAATNRGKEIGMENEKK